jgi:TrmH RNA methyltransferase
MTQRGPAGGAQRRDRRSSAGEQKVHGQHACRALFARRPEAIVRVYLTSDLVRPFGDVLKDCAARHIAYKIVTASELEALTDSKHHEGICVVARPRAVPPLEEALAAPGPAAVLALAEGGNPHNLGAVLRTAAHFGARAVLVDRSAARPGGAALRTAQGGAEWVDTFAVDLEPALAACRRAGFVVGATSSHGGTDLYAQPLPPRAVVLLGSEGQGLPRELLRTADLTWRIPGTGAVESLNVASAAAIILAELWRQHLPTRGGPPRRAR